jgi:hypothetical protein
MYALLHTGAGARETLISLFLKGVTFFLKTRSLIQALEPETLIPLSLKGAATRVVLAGDWQQLGPVVHSRSADQLGLGEAQLQLCCSSCSSVAVVMLLYTAVCVSSYCCILLHLYTRMCRTSLYCYICVLILCYTARHVSPYYYMQLQASRCCSAVCSCCSD